MAFETYVASRYLRLTRSSRFLRFMTSVAIGSVAIGTAALVITFTILDGFERELRGNVIGISSHIRVGTFRNVLVPDEKENRDRLASIQGIASFQPFLEKQAMVLARENIDGVLVKGIPARGDISDLRRKIIAGTYRLDSAMGKPAAIIGKSLASRFGLTVGSKLVLIDAEGRQLMQVPKVQCVITGLYETGMAEYYDDTYIFVDMHTAQTLFSASGTIGGFDVRCTDVAAIPATVDTVQKVLGYPFYPRSTFDIYRHLFVWIDLQQQLIPVVVGSLILISVFNVIATLLLFVIDKTQQIGIFVSMGATRPMIRRIFCYQGIIIGVVGACIGCLFAFVLCYAQQEWKILSLPSGVYYMTSVPIHLRPLTFLLTAAIAITLSFVSSLMPAWLASRLSPLTTIRFH